MCVGVSEGMLQIGDSESGKVVSRSELWAVGNTNATWLFGSETLVVMWGAIIGVYEDCTKV